MPTAYCNLEDAYGPDWGKQKQTKPVKPVEKNVLNAVNGSETANDTRSFCPNCKNCLDKNNTLQQQIIDQNISPRPRWIPQYPSAYEIYDPYNRYWTNFQNQSTKEYFGSDKESKIENMLNFILFILVALFLIQLIEMITKLSN